MSAARDPLIDTRHAPCRTAEDVLNLHGNLPTQLSVPEILQLNRDSQFIGILSKARCPSAVQTGQGRAVWVFQRVMNNLIHKMC